MMKYKVKTVSYNWPENERANDLRMEKEIDTYVRQGYSIKSIQPLLDGEKDVVDSNEGPAAYAFSFTKGYIIFFEKDE